MYKIAESLYCLPGTNVTLYINYISIKKGKDKHNGGRLQKD